MGMRLPTSPSVRWPATTGHGRQRLQPLQGSRLRVNPSLQGRGQGLARARGVRSTTDVLSSFRCWVEGLVEDLDEGYQRGALHVDRAIPAGLRDSALAVVEERGAPSVAGAEVWRGHLPRIEETEVDEDDRDPERRELP